MKYLVCALVTWTSLAGAAVIKGGVEIPTYAEVCRRSDSNFDDCLKGSIQTLIQKIAKRGIKGLQMPSLDPMVIEEYLGSFKGNGYDFRAVIRDNVITGFGDIQISGVRTDLSNPEDLNIEVDLYYPEVKFKGNYKLEGLVATIPVGGKGPFSINATDVSGTVKINGHLVEVDGEQFMRTHRVDLTPKIRKMRIHFDNIIQGNKELTDATNVFLNNFSQVIFEAVMPFTKDGTDKILRYYLNQATLKIPYEQLFPY